MLRVQGSRFKVQARPGAKGCVYEIVYTFYGIGFPSHILACQVWARGSGFSSAAGLKSLPAAGGRPV
jgi:hypothetical protein